jgi:hypothetical protein
MASKANQTLEEKFIEELYNRGLFEEQAQEIMDAVKAAPENESMQGRWTDRATGYPNVLINALWFSVNDAAIEWMDKNAPHHWARPMFTGVMPDGTSLESHIK